MADAQKQAYELAETLEKNARARSEDGRGGLHDPMLDSFGVEELALRKTIEADVIDTMENILPKLITEVDGHQAINGEVLAGIVASHSHLWFIAGLRWAQEHPA